MSLAAPIQIIELDRVEITVERWQWEFAIRRRAEIERHFARRQRERPTIWNGPVFLLNRYQICDGVLHGSSFETDYASFLAWSDWGFPDAGVFNVFAAAALRAADGAYLVGEMAPSTAIGGTDLFSQAARRTARISAPRVRSILLAALAASFWRRPAWK